MIVSRCSNSEQWEMATTLVGEYLLSFHQGSSPALDRRDEDRLRQLPVTFTGSDAGLLLAHDPTANSALGCCGLCRFDATTAEIKRLNVRPGVRNRGIGRLLLRSAACTARAFAYERMVLDVVADRGAAIRLYETLRWHRIPHWEQRVDMVAFEADVPVS